MSEKTKESWLDSLSVYKDIRMLRILLLGAISGFPWVLIASSLSLWLKEEGLSRSTICLLYTSDAADEEDSVDLVKRFPTSCLLYTSPSPRDGLLSRMPSSA